MVYLVDFLVNVNVGKYTIHRCVMGIKSDGERELVLVLFCDSHFSTDFAMEFVELD